MGSRTREDLRSHLLAALNGTRPSTQDAWNVLAHWDELKYRCVRAEEALRQALRFCESYCEATDPDPREDDGEEMSTASAYVLSAMLAIGEGLAAVPEENT